MEVVVTSSGRMEGRILFACFKGFLFSFILLDFLYSIKNDDVEMKGHLKLGLCCLPSVVVAAVVLNGSVTLELVVISIVVSEAFRNWMIHSHL